MNILAIDPGVTGALAFYDKDQHDQIAVFDMPVINGDVNPHALRSLIRPFKPALAVIEQVGPMPKEGVSSVWRFATAFTTARIVVMLEDIPIILVPPSKWKHAMRVKGGKEGKEQCRRLALLSFPQFEKHFALVKHHGRAEAALLAIYASHLNETRNYDVNANAIHREP